MWHCEALGSLQIDIASPPHQINLCPLLVVIRTNVVIGYSDFDLDQDLVFSKNRTNGCR